MRTELINMLLKAAVVTPAQVDRAVEYKYGASLVERLLCLGYGSEDDVFKIIKNKLGLAVISGKELDNIPDDVLQAVPPNLIERYHFLPFYADNTKIHMAFFDPTMDACLNEICFFTSKKIVPFGVKASVLSKALNRYFELNIPETFKYGKEQIVDPKLAPPPLVEQAAPEAPKMPKPPKPGATTANVKPPLPNIDTKPPLPNIGMPKNDHNSEEAEIKMLLEQQRQELAKLKNKFTELQQEPVVQPKPQPVQQQEESPKDSELKVLLEQQRMELSRLKNKVAELEQNKIQDQEQRPQQLVVQQEEFDSNEPEPEMLVSEHETSFEDTDTSMQEFKDINTLDTLNDTVISTVPPVFSGVTTSKSQDKNEVIDAVIMDLNRISTRSVVMFVNNNELISVDDDTLRINLQVPGFFKDVYDSKKRFYGVPPKNYLASEFFKKYSDGYTPSIICVTPVSIEESVFAILYAEEVANPMQVEEIAESMAKAFDMILSN